MEPQINKQTITCSSCTQCKTIKDFFIKMCTARTGLSSKRICGVLGWLVCLFICTYCTIMMIAAPSVVEMLFICSTSLLGIDSITSIWHKNINKND